MVLNEDRFFDPDPAVRRIARHLYGLVKDLPLVCPHGHVDPILFAGNEPFPDPARLILIPDHYIFRMLYSQGITLESLGIEPRDGSACETDSRRIWQLFADHFHLFAGTPTGAWLGQEFGELFGVQEKLGSKNAQAIYDRIQEKLGLEEFRPRALFERFNIEVLTTTDAAFDPLDWHGKIRESGWGGRVIPCFRPDAVVDIGKSDWKERIDDLSGAAGVDVTGFKSYIAAIRQRRDFFRTMGAVSTDQGVATPFTCELTEREADRIFQRALKGGASEEDARLFSGHMLMEMAAMSEEDGLVMQIHPGSFRDHNDQVSRRFGPDKGCDIPTRTEYTRNLRALLDRFGNTRKLTIIVFTLDESAYSRELAPLAGHYPAMKLGPAWWFHDSIEGMKRYRQRVTETAGIYNTVGFNDDTRAFPSIPARHDLSRRVDADYLAGLVARHVIDDDDAERMIKALAYDLVKASYRLD